MAVFFPYAAVFFAAGWVYKEKAILMDIKKRIQTIVIPYLSFGLLVLLYWQFIERRFRDSHRSFTDSLFGLFSGCYDNLDFNVHLWFLPCFFVTVVLSNTIVNLCSRKNSLSCFSSYELYLYYASNAGTSLGGGIVCSST